MDWVGEIEAAIQLLPPEEISRMARWFRERDQNLRDVQMDSDSQSHRLDFLLNEATEELVHGQSAKEAKTSQHPMNADK